MVGFGGTRLAGKRRGSLGRYLEQSDRPMLVGLPVELPDLELDLLTDLAVSMIVEVFDLLLREL